ncbi:hypothetical protein CsSME_00049450 [Camellia sinensis var. sinensis]
MYLSCNNCGGSGHSSINCPSVMSGQGQSYGGGFANRASPGAGVGGGASGECFKCNQSGHCARDCSGLSNVPTGPSVGGGASVSNLEDMGMFQSNGLAAFEVCCNQDCKDLCKYMLVLSRWRF